MPCHSAMTTDVLTLTTDQTVEEALKAMKKNRSTFAPVLDTDQKLQGLFSIEMLFRNIMPVSVPLTGGSGAQVDIGIQAAPGIAKRLKKVDLLTVETIMDKKVAIVHPETPTWEGIKFILEYDRPLMVLEQGSDKFLGMVTYQSALEEIQRLKGSDQ